MPVVLGKILKTHLNQNLRDIARTCHLFNTGDKRHTHLAVATSQWCARASSCCRALLWFSRPSHVRTKPAAGALWPRPDRDEREPGHLDHALSSHVHSTRTPTAPPKSRPAERKGYTLGKAVPCTRLAQAHTPHRGHVAVVRAHATPHAHAGLRPCLSGSHTHTPRLRPSPTSPSPW